MNFIEQVIRADLRAATGFITFFFILNLGLVLLFIFKGKKLGEWKKKIIWSWVIVDLFIIIMVPFMAAKRYQERLIPNEALSEESQDQKLDEKKKKLGIE